jgi:hypothetical protein
VERAQDWAEVNQVQSEKLAAPQRVRVRRALAALEQLPAEEELRAGEALIGRSAAEAVEEEFELERMCSVKMRHLLDH